MRSAKGAWRCWRWRDPALFTALEVTLPVSDPRDIALGDGFICAIDRAGAVTCWGRNLQGQLGDGTAEERPRPTPNGSRDAIRLATGDMRTCAIIDNGAVDCWGSAFGTEEMNVQTIRLGIAHPTTPMRTNAVEVIDVAIDNAGGACRLHVDDTIDCDFAEPVPAPPTSEGHLERVLFYDNHDPCVLTKKGGLHCARHGANELLPFAPVLTNLVGVSISGTLVLGVDTTASLVVHDGTVDVTGKPIHAHETVTLGHVVEVAAAYDGGCALQDDDSIWCWHDKTHAPRRLEWTH